MCWWLFCRILLCFKEAGGGTVCLAHLMLHVHICMLLFCFDFLTFPRPKSQGASLSSTLANLDVSNGHLPPHPSTTNSDPSLTAASLSHTQLQQQQMAAAAAAPLTANWNIVEPNLDPGEAEKLYCLCNQVGFISWTVVWACLLFSNNFFFPFCLKLQVQNQRFRP